MAADSAHQRESDPREEFYNLHHRRLAAYIRRRVADQTAAEQIAQMTWAAIFRNWGDHREPEVVLLVVAKRRIVDWYQARSMAPVAIDDQLLIAVHDDLQLRRTWAEAADPATAVPTRVDLQRALGRLTSRQRQVLCLSCIDDLSRAQIAGLLAISEQTVKTTLADAKAAMRTSPTLAGYRTTQTMATEVTR